MLTISIRIIYQIPQSLPKIWGNFTMHRYFLQYIGVFVQFNLRNRFNNLLNGILHYYRFNLMIFAPDFYQTDIHSQFIHCDIVVQTNIDILLTLPIPSLRIGLLGLSVSNYKCGPNPSVSVLNGWPSTFWHLQSLWGLNRFVPVQLPDSFGKLWKMANASALRPILEPVSATILIHILFVLLLGNPVPCPAPPWPTATARIRWQTNWRTLGNLFLKMGNKTARAKWAGHLRVNQWGFSWFAAHFVNTCTTETERCGSTRGRATSSSCCCFFNCVLLDAIHGCI